MPSNSNWLSTPPPPTSNRPSNPTNPDLITSLRQHLTSKSLPPTTSFLTHLISTLNVNLPLPSLKASAYYRILHSDLKISLSPSPYNTFPTDISDSIVPIRTLTAKEVVVQVLDILDISRSKWSQVEAIEAAERGETTKGREIIRVVPGEEGLNDWDGGDGEGTGAKGPMKVLLEDGKGTRVWGFEMTDVPGLASVQIGGKLVLKGVEACRSVVMLEGVKVGVLGGRVEAWSSKWREGRKEALKKGIAEVNGQVEDA